MIRAPASIGSLTVASLAVPDLANCSPAQCSPFSRTLSLSSVQLLQLHFHNLLSSFLPRHLSTPHISILRMLFNSSPRLSHLPSLT